MKHYYEAEISAFLNKHCSDNTRVKIHDYEFQVNSISDIVITKITVSKPEDTLVIQFYSEAKISRTDTASKVKTSNIPVFIRGTAFYIIDLQNDDIIHLIDIDLIKDKI